MPRSILPQRRLCLRFDLNYGSIDYAVSVGLGRDMRVAEVFISSHRRVGMEMSAIARDAAVVISLALQHGCALETIAGAVTRDTTGAPSSLAGAVVDAILAGGMA